MVPNQFFQFLLLLENWSCFAWDLFPSIKCLPLCTLAGSRVSHQLGDIVLCFLVILPFVARVIYPKQTSHDSRATEIVDGEIRAALILVFQKGESLALSGFLVAN